MVLCDVLAAVLTEREANNAFGVTTTARRNADPDFEPTGDNGGLTDPALIVFRYWEPLGTADAALRLRNVVDPNTYDVERAATAHLHWFAGLNRGVRVGRTHTWSQEGWGDLDDPNIVGVAFFNRIRGRWPVYWGWPEDPGGGGSDRWSFPADSAPGTITAGFHALKPYPWGFSDEQSCSIECAASGMWLSAISQYHPKYTLTVRAVGEVDGHVDASPDLALYARGAEVELHAVAHSTRHWDHWLLFDPEYPGDVGHADVDDVHNPILIVMDADREVEAHFECGSGVELLLPLLVIGLGLCGFVSRRMRDRD
jgi:hypothetical protein